MMCSLASLLIAAFFAGYQETPDIYEEYKVRVYPLQVTVQDKKGEPVKGLTAKDFKVFLKGKRQKIDSVIAIDLPAPVAGVNLESSPTPIGEASKQSPRLFAFVFDMRNNGRYYERARMEADAFVRDKIHETDRVAVFYLGQKGVHMATGFTSDRQVLAQALSKTYRVSRAGCRNCRDRSDPLQDLTLSGQAEMKDMMALVTQSIMRRHKGQFIEYAHNFTELAKALGMVTGRKNVVFFSSGFSLPPDIESAASLSSDIYMIVDELQRSGCVVYSVDTSGPMLLSRKGVDLLSAVSSDTGGEIYMNAFKKMDGVLEEIDKINRHYYMVNIRIEFDPPKGKMTRLKIKVGRKGTRVQTSRYLQLNPDLGRAGALQRALAFNEFSQSMKQTTPFYASMQAFPMLAVDDKIAVRVALEVDGNLSSGHKPPKTAGRGSYLRQLEIYTLAMDPQSRKLLAGRHHLLTYAPHQIAEVTHKTGIKHFSDLLLDPGHYLIKTVVRDLENGNTTHLVDEIRLEEAPTAAGPMPFSDRPWVVPGSSRMVEGVAHEGVRISRGMSLAAELVVNPGDPVFMSFLVEPEAVGTGDLRTALLLVDDQNRIITAPPESLESSMLFFGCAPARCQIKLDTGLLNLEPDRHYLVLARSSRDEELLAKGAFNLYLAAK